MSRYYKHEEIDRRDDDYEEPYEDRAADEDEAVAVEHRRWTWWGDGVAGQVNSLIALMLLTVEGLLGLRFVLVAFGANPQSGFVDFIMNVTGPLVQPFENAFSDRTWDQGVIEVNTALAMLAYFLAGVLVMLLVRALTPPVREDRGETIRRRHVHES